VVAIGSLVGAILGSGGGAEVESAVVLQEARRRFGRRAGDRVWADFRSAEDPEAPVTAWKGSFPYGATPRKRAKGSLALPDPGSVRFSKVSAATAGTPHSALRTPHFPKGMSNALVVSAKESESGHPIAVFGPQTAYFAPEVLMEQDVHAPGIDARGVAFPGTNVFVQLGHGQDYAWSATTSAQDLIDTFAVDLCEPDGSKPTIDSMSYRFRGACRPIEVLERKNSWQPTAADSTPAGSETLHAERTLLGIVTARATIKGKPVAYTRLRASYRHEPDAGLAFSYFNDPAHMRNAKEFQSNAFLIPFTFNWFYVDDRDIAYFSAGTNPQRARGTDPNLPIRGVKRFEWKGLDPDKVLFDYTPQRRHPQFLNQPWAADWNNKQGHGYRAADNNWGYGPEYRVKPLRQRIARGVRGSRKMNPAELVNAMEDSATVDIRGAYLVPLALQLLRGERDPAVRAAAAQLRAWVKEGAHRIDRDGDGRYEHADAIRIMDAWWPRWVAAEFKPSLGKRLFDAIRVINELSNDPNNHGDHLGSAWQNGWYGYVSKDLRTMLGRRVRGRYSRTYCGRGSRKRCRTALAASLKEAQAVPAAALYKGDPQCVAAGRDGDQACWDAIWFRPLGAVTQPLMPWQNRPTVQQVVEITSHRPR
jgi:acyl-homoserine lactone acylase PvdQ